MEKLQLIKRNRFIVSIVLSANFFLSFFPFLLIHWGNKKKTFSLFDFLSLSLSPLLKFLAYLEPQKNCVKCWKQIKQRQMFVCGNNKKVQKANGDGRKTEEIRKLEITEKHFLALFLCLSFMVFNRFEKATRNLFAFHLLSCLILSVGA